MQIRNYLSSLRQNFGSLSWEVIFIYAFVGVAGLNIFNNYNAVYVTYPYFGVVERWAALRSPGEGSTVASAPPPRPPGEGSTVASAPPPRPPGGDQGYSSDIPNSISGGFETSFWYVTIINFWYLLFAILGGILGGLVAHRVFQNHNLKGFFEIVFAFIFSRALLYFCGLLIDIYYYLF